MARALLVLIFCVCALHSAFAQAAADDAPTTAAVVVELFTSEGCSSCPPAEALLAELLAKPPVNAEIIPLAFHVDYWNRLGWTDPFSSEKWSERQRWYAGVFKSSQVYTPQMIVDGQAQFTGSDRARAMSALSQAAAARKPALRLGVTPDGSGRITVSVASGDPPAGRLFLAITEDNLATNVLRGENSGKRLAHIGVVRHLAKLGEVPRGAPLAIERSVELQSNWSRRNLRVVVFIQDATSGRMVAAAAARVDGRRSEMAASQTRSK